jgi:hypothetical protein
VWLPCLVRVDRQGGDEIRVLTSQDEARAVAVVMERPVGSFRQVDVAELRDMVYRSYHYFTGTPIRDLAPVPVERMARNDLRASATCRPPPSAPGSLEQRNAGPLRS